MGRGRTGPDRTGLQAAADTAARPIPHAGARFHERCGITLKMIIMRLNKCRTAAAVGLCLLALSGCSQLSKYVGNEESVDYKSTVAMGDRSEEHTSELQSLMRISYAVFCLKKKN